MIVEMERNNFGGVLLDYCLRKHGQEQGASRFAALLGLTHLFLGIANKMKHIYMLSKVCFVINIYMTTQAGLSNAPALDMLACGTLVDELFDS